MFNLNADHPVRSEDLQAKKGFILFKDLKETTDGLDDHEAGKLLKAILSYQNGLGFESSDRTTKLLMSQIVNQFKREDEKWMKRRDASAANGRKGGRPRNNPLGSLGNENNLDDPRKPVTATVTVTDTVTSKVSESEASSRQLALQDRPKPHRINGAKRAKPVPYEQIFAMYADKCPSLERIRVVDQARKNGAKRLWGRAGGSKDPKLAMEYIGLFFDGAQDSAFLRGEKKTEEYPGDYGTFEVITRDGWITKIMEGRAQ